VIPSFAVALAIVCDLIAVLFRSRAAVIAENLFLRRQLALYLERKTRRHRPTPVAKFAMVILSRFFPWASALAIVKPDTFVTPEAGGLYHRYERRAA
jgi:putative transposase